MLQAIATVGRIVGYLILFVVGLILAQASPQLFERALPEPWPALFGAAIGIVAVLGATLLMRRVVDRKPWRGMALPSPRWGALAAGFAAGGVFMLLFCGVQFGLGWLRPTGSELDTGVAGALAATIAGLVTMLGVGFTEELALRGYIFQTLGERMPVWSAVLVSGLLFGLLHAANAGFGPGFILSAVIITAVFALFRLVTGSLWFPIGFHAAWNFVQYNVIGVSNVNDRAGDDALVQVAQSGPQLWTGAAPSIEGGLLLILMELGLIAALLVYARRRGIDWRARLDLDGRPAARIPHDAARRDPG